MQRSASISPAAPNLAQARRAAADAVHRARDASIGDGPLGRACLRLAGACYQLFDYAACYSAALEAADLLGRAGDVERRGHAINFCFIVSIETGELARGLDHVRRALADARLRGDHAALSRLLINQAVVFDLMHEYEAAVRCLEESLAVQAMSSAVPHGLFVARVNLAEVHLGESERRSDPDAVAALRQHAVEALPALDASVPLAALSTWISVAARLARIEEARQAAVGMLRRVRASGDAQRARTTALLALGELHVQAGRPDKGAHRLGRAIERLRAAANRSHLGSTESRLARLYAGLGDHARALHWQRRADEDGRALHADHHELHWRLAALERDYEAQRARRDEVALHAQRLAVVGRLLSEIYHALARPIRLTRRTLARCVAHLDGGTDIRDQTPLLGQVLEQIDAASALARQLKIFSYRAQPQSMDVTLAAAVREAWRGMSLWRRSAALSVDIVGDETAMVQVDVQRLAVLLRILLIEVERSEGGGTLEARILRHDDGVGLQLSCRRSGARAVEAGSVGLTLCAEIAQEMSGQLSIAASPADRLCFELHLPIAPAYPAG